jgi:hypothetical protein
MDGSIPAWQAIAATIGILVVLGLGLGLGCFLSRGFQRLADRNIGAEAREAHLHATSVRQRELDKS